MEEVSNKTLAVLLVGAIAVSLFGTFLVLSKPGAYITGMAGSGSGDVNVTIDTLTAITVTGEINFQNGFVSAEQASATINTNGTCINNNTNWCKPTNTNTINITNVGNEHLVINYTATSIASTWIGGTTATESSKIAGADTSAIVNYGCYTGDNAWTEFATTQQTVCSNLTENALNNSLGVHVQLVIPSDALIGKKTNVLTFYGDPA